MAIVGGITKFIPNYPGIALLGSTPAMVLCMESKAETVKEGAIDHWNAAGPHPYETGDYASSFETSAGLMDGLAMGRVETFDYKAWWLEVGTEDTPAFSPLSGGAADVGIPVGPAHSGVF